MYDDTPPRTNNKMLAQNPNLRDKKGDSERRYPFARKAGKKKRDSQIGWYTTANISRPEIAAGLRIDPPRAKKRKLVRKKLP